MGHRQAQPYSVNTNRNKGLNVDDAVHQPAHYAERAIETIDYIADSLGPEPFRDYCVGNVIKYVSRWRQKNGEEDLRKASVYLLWAINGNPSVKIGRPPVSSSAVADAFAYTPPSNDELQTFLDDELPLRAGTAMQPCADEE